MINVLTYCWIVTIKKIEIRFQNWNSFSKSKFVFNIEIRFQNRNLIHNRNCFSIGDFFSKGELFSHIQIFLEWQNSFDESGFYLRRKSWDLKKSNKNLKSDFFSFTWHPLDIHLTSTICEWDLCRSKSRRENKRKKFENFFFDLLY